MTAFSIIGCGTSGVLLAANLLKQSSDCRVIMFDPTRAAGIGMLMGPEPWPSAHLGGVVAIPDIRWQARDLAFRMTAGQHDA